MKQTGLTHQKSCSSEMTGLTLPLYPEVLSITQLAIALARSHFMDLMLLFSRSENVHPPHHRQAIHNKPGCLKSPHHN